MLIGEIDYDNDDSVYMAFEELYNSISNQTNTREEIKLPVKKKQKRKIEKEKTSRRGRFANQAKLEKDKGKNLDREEIERELSQYRFLQKKNKPGSLYHKFISAPQSSREQFKSDAIVRTCEEEDPQIIDKYYPILSIDLKSYAEFSSIDSFSYGETKSCCQCHVCHGKFENGGWLKQLAYVIKCQTKDGLTIRAHALKALERMETHLAKTGYCNLSFHLCMAIKSSIEFGIMPASGFWARNGARLQHLCIGILRSELARRLVENHNLIAVKQEHIHPTRAMFERIVQHFSENRLCLASKGPIVAERAAELQYMLNDEFLDQRPSIDPLAWEEINGSLDEIVGDMGSGRQIFAAWSFFEGRCVTATADTIDENYYTYLMSGFCRLK